MMRTPEFHALHDHLSGLLFGTPTASPDAPQHDMDVADTADADAISEATSG